MYLILISEVTNWWITVVHLSILGGILISQRLWYRREFQKCSICLRERTFHDKRKYPEFINICNKFTRSKVNYN